MGRAHLKLAVILLGVCAAAIVFAETSIPLQWVAPQTSLPEGSPGPQVLEVITGGAELGLRDPYQFTLEDLRQGIADLFRLPLWIEGEVAKTFFAKVGLERLKLGLVAFLLGLAVFLVGLGFLTRWIGRVILRVAEPFRLKATEDYGSRLIYALLTFARKNIFLPLTLLLIWGLTVAVQLPASLAVSILATLVALTVYWPVHILLVLVYDPDETGTRLVNLATAAARRIYRWLQVSLAVLVFPLLAIFLLEHHGYRPPVIEFLHFAFRILVALCAAWALTFRRALFTWERPPEAGISRALYQWAYWLYHPFVVGLLLLFGAAGLGYRNFSNFILARVGVTAAVVVGAFVVRKILLDLIRNRVRSLARDVVARFRTGEEHVTEQLKPTLHLIVTWGVPIVAAIILVDRLGVGWETLGLGGLHRILTTPFVKAVNTHISVASIVQAGIILMLFVLGGRVVAGILSDFVFPLLKVGEGLRYALGRSVGYVFGGIGLISGISAIGISWTALTVFFGAVGVGIGLGLQKLANNLISGLTLLFELPIKRGDFIEAGGYQGVVHKIGVRATVLVTRDNIYVVVPNSAIMEATVVNWTYQEPKTRVRIPFGVAYGTEIQKVDRIVLEIAAANPRILKKPVPQVILKQFGASSIDFELIVWVEEPTVILNDEINRAIDARFRAEGIEIPFSQVDVHFRTALDVLKKDV